MENNEDEKIIIQVNEQFSNLVDNHHKWKTQDFSEHQAGGHPGTIIHKQDKIYKKAKKSEFIMYEYLYSTNCSENIRNLKTILPKYFGKDIINGEEFLILENLHSDYDHPNLIDCKLGRITWKSDANLKKIEVQMKKNKESINQHFAFRITGLIIRDSEGKVVEELKKPLVETKVTKDNIYHFLAKLLSYDDVIQKHLIDEIILKTENILKFFKGQTIFKFIASSVYYVIGKNNKVQARLIDIAHPEDSNGKIDENLIEGLEGLIHVWKNLLREYE